MSESSEVLEYLEHLDAELPRIMPQLEQILRYVYMGESDQLQGGHGAREYKFNNVTIKVFYGK